MTGECRALPAAFSLEEGGESKGGGKVRRLGWAATAPPRGQEAPP